MGAVHEVQPYTEEIFEYVKELEMSVLTVRAFKSTLAQSQETHPKQPIFIEYKRHELEDDPSQSVELDDQLIQATKGAGFGVYMSLRNRGYQDIANITMSKEGIPQRVPVEKLMKVDREYKL